MTVASSRQESAEAIRGVSRVIAQQNVIAHEYGEIKQERLWVVATIHVEDLIPKLRMLVPPVPPAVDA